MRHEGDIITVGASSSSDKSSGGLEVNAKRIYRLHGLEGLEVRTKPREKLASRRRNTS
jgi:hypothetical protein